MRRPGLRSWLPASDQPGLSSCRDLGTEQWIEALYSLCLSEMKINQGLVNPPLVSMGIPYELQLDSKGRSQRWSSNSSSRADIVSCSMFHEVINLTSEIYGLCPFYRGAIWAQNWSNLTKIILLSNARVETQKSSVVPEFLSLTYVIWNLGILIPS